VTLLSESRSELDAMIADLELTLVSIIQGVALTVLIETSLEAVANLNWIMWPYVLSGLVIILIFWSRVVLHILTVIRWPLEFGHNFLYVACALVEAFSFAQLGNPGRWFAFVAAFLAFGWLLFAYDLRLIRMRPVVRARETRSVAQPRIVVAGFLSGQCCLRGRNSYAARVFSRPGRTYLANHAATDRFWGIFVIRRHFFYQARAFD